MTSFAGDGISLCTSIKGTTIQRISSDENTRREALWWVNAMKKTELQITLLSRGGKLVQSMGQGRQLLAHAGVVQDVQFTSEEINSLLTSRSSAARHIALN